MGRHKGSAFCCIKYCFIAFNILVWLLGLGVLTVGIWMHVNRAPYNTLLPDTAFLSATVLTICAGAIIFILGFCGCCGAILESQCMLVVYFVFVLVIFGLEVAATSLCLTHKQQINRFLHEEVKLSIQEDYRPELAGKQNGGVVAVVDSIQTHFECCGIDNHTDWYSISAWPDKTSVPDSCCVQPIDGCGYAGSTAAFYSRGCLEEVKFWFMKNMYTLGVLALVVAVIQILTMTAAVAMFCCLRKNKSIL
ncbi:tetraspanin-4-like [Ruditapes philippinarum]|uniref:tetraspanin-4-like n=1 Tax=Ruditapes philippinarum TaxID=129788 RepID=UPI00295B31CB|nr:tetraspanin-4-like [Ruditapes philippinarum]